MGDSRTAEKAAKHGLQREINKNPKKGEVMPANWQAGLQSAKNVSSNPTK